MSGCLVFNHHSLPFDTLEEAEQSVPDFLKICIQSKNAGLTPVLVNETVDRSWFRLELSKHYFWQDWYDRNKDGIHKERVRVFRSLATGSPFFSAKDMDEGADLFDVSFQGRKDYSALRASAWHEAPLVSFPTRVPWITSPLAVQVESLDSTGEIITEEKSLLNISSRAICEHELFLLIRQRNDRIRSGKEIFARRTELYPNITLCGKAQQQLNSWSASSTILNQVKSSLHCLTVFSERWNNGEYPHYSADFLKDSGLNHRVSGESQSVMGNSRLRREREFYLPEGEKVCFENHIKLSHGYRIHFYPDSRLRHVYVGYIGIHLKLE